MENHKKIAMTNFVIVLFNDNDDDIKYLVIFGKGFANRRPLIMPSLGYNILAEKGTQYKLM